MNAIDTTLEHCPCNSCAMGRMWNGAKRFWEWIRPARRIAYWALIIIFIIKFSFQFGQVSALMDARDAGCAYAAEQLAK